MEYVIGLIIGLLIGFIAAWFIAKYKFHSEKGLSQQDVEEKYVTRELFTKVEDDLLAAKKNAEGKNLEVLNFSNTIASQKEIINNLNEKLDTQKKDIEELQKRMTTEFENIANRILESRSSQFLEASSKNIADCDCEHARC